MNIQTFIRWFILSLSLTPALVPVTVYGIDDVTLYREAKLSYTLTFSGRVEANGHPYSDREIQVSVKTDHEDIVLATTRTEMDGGYTVTLNVNEYINGIADWQIHAVAHHPDIVLAEGRNILRQNLDMISDVDLVVPGFPEAKTLLAMR